MTRMPQPKGMKIVGRIWENLSEAYRKRLTRGGIDKADYESGAKLSKARGHAATPEHPEDVAKNPGKYRKYIDKKEQDAPAERRKLVNDAVRHGHKLLGNKEGYNRKAHRLFMVTMTDDELREYVTLSADDIVSRAKGFTFRKDKNGKKRPYNYGSASRYWYHGW